MNTKMKISELVQAIEEHAPLKYQETYDNSGLIIGSFDVEIKKVLICLDVTLDVIDEAIEKDFKCIISHHPVIFDALKRINGNSNTEKIIIKAIKNNIAIYAAHTNLDNARTGLNKMLAEKIGLVNTRILAPQKGLLKKLVTFCPTESIEKVRTAIFEAGAGHIGEYDCCSYNIEGQGTFRASENTNPYKGTKNSLHFENEVRLETIYPVHLESKVIKALLNAHPYEEVAYDIYLLDNAYLNSGAGMIGEIEKTMKVADFIKLLKTNLNLKVVKTNKLNNNKIKKVAVCGGSGAFLINQALLNNADIFISSEFKHNHFVDMQDRLIIADIGHYESELFAKEIIKSFLIKKFPKFAVEISQTEENPVYYL